jgi:para-aminobenzoate synthetase component 1
MTLSTRSRLQVRIIELPHVVDPLDVYLRLPRPGRMLLESSDTAHPGGRWSFVLGFPLLGLESRGDRVTLSSAAGRRELRADPLEVMRQELAGLAVEDLPDGAPPLVGGWAGAFSYDLGRSFERLPVIARDDLRLPDITASLFGAVVALDSLEKTTFLVVLERDGRPLAGETTVGRLLEAVTAAREEPHRLSIAQGPVRAELPPVADISRLTYLACVRRVKHHIREGDIYQANFTQRFRTRFNGTPAELHARLRAVNPAPFAALLEAGDGLAVVSASPERFLQVEHGLVTSRPIKGTRKRTGDVDADLLRARELLASEKDGAELAMIVDLVRNDLGRVCRTGSVKVERARELEQHPTVLHLVATVTGQLAEGRDVFDLLRASFPGGSITGAPKIRAMEIIEELEGVRRGFYTGSLGYLSACGRADLSIAIRTAILRGHDVFFSAGGGIVADSEPEAEHAETLDKVSGLVRALGHEEVLIP